MALLTSCIVHLEANSHSTNPQAYMSIRKNESLVKFIAPSNTSGAIYLRVPTCEEGNNHLRVTTEIINNLIHDVHLPGHVYRRKACLGKK
jgi:hypothetical protein